MQIASHSFLNRDDVFQMVSHHRQNNLVNSFCYKFFFVFNNFFCIPFDHNFIIFVSFSVFCLFVFVYVFCIYFYFFVFHLIHSTFFSSKLHNLNWQSIIRFQYVAITLKGGRMPKATISCSFTFNGIAQVKEWQTNRLFLLISLILEWLREKAWRQLVIWILGRLETKCLAKKHTEETNTETRAGTICGHIFNIIFWIRVSFLV